MADVDEPLTLWIALPVEILVPRRKPRERILKECQRARGILGPLIDAQGGRRVNWRLDDPARLDMRRGVGALGGVPEVYARDIHADGGIEDYVGQETVFPLGIKKMGELPRSALLVKM